MRHLQGWTVLTSAACEDVLALYAAEFGPESCWLKSALTTESVALTVLEGLDLPLGTFQLQDEGINVIPVRSKTLQSTASLLHVQGHSGLGAACLRLARGWTGPCWLWQMMAIATDLRIRWRKVCVTANAAVE